MTGWLSNSSLRTGFVLVFLGSGVALWSWNTTERPSEASLRQSPPIVISFPERRLRMAERQLQLRPKDPAAYAEMATAYMEKARETGDGAFYGRAEAACNKALQLEPGNYPALRLVSWAYSAFAPEETTTFAHFSVSDAMTLPKSSGVPGMGLPPISASFSRIFGSASA